MEKQIIDLGWANGWSKTPEVLRQANEAGFEEECTYHSERGESHYRCETNDTIITWKIDTSD